MFTYLLLREREREHECRKGRERERERERERILSRLWAISTEPDAGLKLITHEITTWAEAKSQMLNRLSHPGAPRSKNFKGSVSWVKEGNQKLKTNEKWKADIINAKMMGAALKIKPYFIYNLIISSLVIDQNQQWHLYTEAWVHVARREFKYNLACCEYGFQNGNETSPK